MARATISLNALKPSYFAKYFTRRLALACTVVAISTFNYAFDQQGFNNTQAMVPFNRTFGVCNAKGECTLPATYLSLIGGVIYAGFALGAWIGSFISARYGRRMTIFCMSIWAICTATILVTSGVSLNKWQLFAGRLLNYLYIGMELSSVPVYQSEVAPAAVRGLTVGTYQLSLGIGGILISVICRGTSEINDNRSWMIPYGLYYVIPTFIASCIWFIPESPRWLLMKNKDDEALKALRAFRGDKGEMSPEAEMEMIRVSLQEEADQGTWSDLFKGHNLRRTLVVIGVGFFFQGTGNAFTGHFSAIFIASLGTVNPFNITVAQTVITTVTAFIGIQLIDHVGRRKMWLFGSTFMFLVLMCAGGLGIRKPITYRVSQGIVATMELYQAAYTATVAPLYYTLITEIPASRLRDKTVRLGATANIATIFVVAFTLPYLLDPPYANLGSEVGFIYGSIAFLSIIFGYFCIPELKNRSLEEVEKMFETGIPLRKFGEYETVSNLIGNEATKLQAQDTQELPRKQPVNDNGAWIE